MQLASCDVCETLMHLTVNLVRACFGDGPFGGAAATVFLPFILKQLTKRNRSASELFTGHCGSVRGGVYSRY